MVKRRQGAFVGRKTPLEFPPLKQLCTIYMKVFNNIGVLHAYEHALNYIFFTEIEV